jgi:isoleucyl-tRNA synthetase
VLKKWNAIMKVKTVVNKGLEKARSEDLIRHSLEASVTVYADGELFTLLKAYEEQLPYVFITSYAKVEPLSSAPEDAISDDEIKGLKVVVERAPGKKCERCWMYSEEVGKDTEYPDVCPRCARVLKELEKRG